MLIDALLSFVPIGAPLSLVQAQNVATPSPNVIDLLGVGVGQAPTNIIGLTATGGVPLFGMDPGVGAIRPEMNVSVGTAFVGATTTLAIALQGAPDTGAAGGYLPGAWITIVDQPGLTAANLTANSVPFRFPWLPDFPANLKPRYLRLLFTTSNTGAAPGSP